MGSTVFKHIENTNFFSLFIQLFLDMSVCLHAMVYVCLFIIESLLPLHTRYRHYIKTIERINAEQYLNQILS